MNFLDMSEIEDLIPDIPFRARIFFWIAAVFAVPTIVFAVLFFIFQAFWMLVVLAAGLSGALSYLIGGLMVRSWVEDEE
jgi:hypothetical protein